jgi:hypothetical protein
MFGTLLAIVALCAALKTPAHIGGSGKQHERKQK